MLQDLNQSTYSFLVIYIYWTCERQESIFFPTRLG